MTATLANDLRDRLLDRLRLIEAAKEKEDDDA